jgi:hypothetical protein
VVTVRKEKNVVYIPHWIQELCQRHSLPLEAVMDYSKIGPLLSLEDQALFLGLQTYTLYDCVFTGEGYPRAGSNSTTAQYDGVTDYLPSGVLCSEWRKSIAAEDVVSKNALDNADSLSYRDGGVREALIARLFSAESAEMSHKKPFITYDLTRTTVGVVVFPGFFNQEKFNSFNFDLVVSILKVLYVYNTYAAECKSPYFRKYLETLASRNG